MHESLIKNLKTINYHFMADTIELWMSKNEHKILKLAKDRMLRGDSVDGGVIGIYRSKSYELFKARLNPLAGGVVDLFLTGALQKRMTIIDDGNLKFEIISTDGKYDLIAEKYGAEQFGLTDQEKQSVINEAMNCLIDKIKEKYE